MDIKDGHTYSLPCSYKIYHYTLTSGQKLTKLREFQLTKLHWTSVRLSQRARNREEWIPDLRFIKTDCDIILNGEKLEDQHITAGLRLVQKADRVVF